MLRLPAATSPAASAPLVRRTFLLRRFGLTEAVVFVLVLSLFFSLLALRKLEVERDEWRDRLLVTLKSTADVARASEARLQKTIAWMNDDSENVNGDKGELRIALDQKGDPIPQESREAIESDSTDPAAFKGSTTVILFCYSRAQYLQRTLNSLKSRILSAEAFRRNGLRVMISQDGNDAEVQRVSREFVGVVQALGVKAEHVQQPHYDASREGHMAAYYSLSMHYLKGLTDAFSDGAARVIILEDDLEMAVDFFPFFEAFADMLDRDDSLLAVSAWNDHGQESHAVDAEQFYRTDFFPGLGWMLPRRIWEELKPKWPRAFWDDWLRSTAQRKNRHIIHPEVSRTITFGESGGASQGQFFSQYLRTMRLNHVNVKYTKSMVNALEKERFDDWFMAKVADAKLTPLMEIQNGNGLGSLKQDYKVEYSDLSHYARVAGALGMMTDVKDGVPRSGYRGIVPVRYNGAQVYVVPSHVPGLAIRR